MVLKYDILDQLVVKLNCIDEDKEEVGNLDGCF